MDDTIAAVSTPPGQGAVALIRISGSDAVAVAEKVFRGAGEVATLPARMQHFGEIVDGGGERIDEVLLTVFCAPASYTGEDVVEIGCHGGMLVTGKVLEAVLSAGARAAEPGEFSKRAFLNCKMDLTQAEAVMDLISARTEMSLRAANRQLEGRLGERVCALRESLLGILAHVEAYIDFPDEDIDPQTGGQIVAQLSAFADAAGELVATAEQGRVLREGLGVVLAGQPNVGKSSLLNVLLGFDRAIVSEIAGTTRDTIEETINLKGLPVRLIDTAGLRESDDTIETEGVERARRQAGQADLVLLVADGAQPQTEPALDSVGDEVAHRILVLNKADLGIHESWSGVDAVEVSCTSGEGIEELCNRIIAEVSKGTAGWGNDLVTVNARHQRCLVKAQQHAEAAAKLVGEGQSPEFSAIDIRDALDSIGEIVGKADVEELLGAIFSAFCIGK